MQFLFQDQSVIFFQLFFALMLGMVIGVERVIAHKTAGLRTYAIVSLTACLFIVISQSISTFPAASAFQIAQIPAAIITGIGFLGAGLIIFQDKKVRGLTTAASLWSACGVGMAVGFKLYFEALSATILILFSFTLLWFVEDWLKKIAHKYFEEEEA